MVLQWQGNTYLLFAGKIKGLLVLTSKPLRIIIDELT
jgi:hypothetical protein